MRTVTWTSMLAYAVVPLAADSTTLTAEQWRNDLAYLAKELPSRHKNAFASVTRADFEKQVADLDSRIPKLSEMEIRAGLLKIIASVGDGHTSIWSWGRLEPMRVLPISLYWFKDGLFLLASTQPNATLLV